MSVDYRKILFLACEKLLSDLDRFTYSFVYEADFRCGLYSEIVDIMEQEGLMDYHIRAEHIYEDPKNKADIALGENQEIAIELKFDLGWVKTDFIKATEQLENYLLHGAKEAFLIYLHRFLPEYFVLASKKIDIDKIGLEGDWKIIGTDSDIIGELLIAILKKESEF